MYIYRVIDPRTPPPWVVCCIELFQERKTKERIGVPVGPRSRSRGEEEEEEE
jgi:hypothetical protein